METLISLFLVKCKHSGISQRTVGWYEQKLSIYQRFLKSQTQRIGPETVMRFLDQLTCTDESKSGYWRTIRAFHRWAAMNGYGEDPTATLRPRFTVAKPRNIMPREVFERVIASIRPVKFHHRRDAAFFATLYYTACRSSEIRNLRMQDIDLQGRTIVVLGKGNKSRLVPIVRPLVAVLVGYLGHVAGEYAFPASLKRDTPLDISHASHLWVEYQHAAGITRPWRVHDLRHAAATWLYEHDMDLADIQALLGHSSIAVTRRYARFSVARITSKMDSAWGNHTTLKERTYHA